MSVDTSAEDRSPSGGMFWAGLVIGWMIIAFGLREFTESYESTNPTYSFPLAVGLNIAHDAVLAPMVCAVGYLVTRIVPAGIRPKVTWGLFASAIVVAISFVPLSGFGRRADNPSVLPLDYTTAVLTVVGVVWLLVVAAISFAAVRGRHAGRPTQVDSPST